MKEINQNLVRINDLEYYYTLALFNSKGRFINLSPAAVKVFIIKEDVFSPFVSAQLVMDIEADVLNRGFKIEETVFHPVFNFNESNEDFVYFEMIPRMFEDDSKDVLNQRVWNLRYVFAIDDIEPVDSTNLNSRLRRLVLQDVREDKLNEKNIGFSTALFGENNGLPVSQQEDGARMMYTGDAMKEIIKMAVGDDEEFDDDWDRGRNKIFYTSPTFRTAKDDLEHLYKTHLSPENEDFCIMNVERFTNKWTLEPFGRICEKVIDQNNKKDSGEYLLEHFFVADAGEIPAIPVSDKVPVDFGLNKNISMADYNKLEKFDIIEISKDLSDETLTTQVAHGFNFKDGRFDIFTYPIMDIKNHFAENYSNKMKYHTQRDLDPLFYVNENRRENKRVKHTYGVRWRKENLFENFSRNNVLKSGVFTNLGIQFEVQGITYRQAGKFFSISKHNKYVPSEFENKLQGLWYCTRVEHVISPQEYTNKIIGVKLNKLGEKIQEG